MHRKWWTLLAVSVATFMLLLDVTIVNVALPDIRRSLGSSFEDLQWVIDAYALALAALLLTAGSVADIVGRKHVFIAGLGVFTAASLVCGLSTTPTMLNLSRGVQGAGAAMMFATALALIGQEFHGRERGTAFGIWGAVTGGSVAIGPLVGGALTRGIGWEAIFFVNVPIGVAAIALAQLKLAEAETAARGRIDWPGLLTFSTGLFCFVLALIEGNDRGWGSTRIVALFTAAVVLLAAFVVLEHRRRDPMLDLTLFRKPAFGGASIAAFVLSAAMFSLFLYLTLYLQDILGYDPLETGLRFLPSTLLSFLVAPIAGRLSARVPVRGLLGGGLLLVGVGLILISGLDARSSWTALLPGFILTGAGIGLVNPPLASTAIAVVPPARAGMASGINTTFRQVGIATGVAGYGAIFQHQVTQNITAALGSTPFAGRAHQFADAVYAGASREAIAAAPLRAHAQLERVAATGFTSGLDQLVIIGAVVSIVGALLSFALVRQRDFAPAQSGATSPAPEPQPEPAAAT